MTRIQVYYIIEFEFETKRDDDVTIKNWLCASNLELILREALPSTNIRVLRNNTY